MVTGAHPRSRGEHAEALVGAIDAQGSSPLARGTHFLGDHVPAGNGLIPARAGNTPASRR